MSEDKISVMLVDDHAIVRNGIRAFIEVLPDIEIIAEAETGSEAVIKAEKFVPDVILMDLKMPGMDGVEATWRVCQVSPHSQVIILTSYHDDSHIFPAIKAGALSYILKNVEPDELAAAIRAAGRGEVILSPKVASRLIGEYRKELSEGMQDYLQLTDREQEVLSLIAEGLPNAGIAEKLVISEKTVKSHVSNILSKLHLADRTQAAVFAWREGIIKKEEE